MGFVARTLVGTAAGVNGETRAMGCSCRVSTAKPRWAALKFEVFSLRRGVGNAVSGWCDVSFGFGVCGVGAQVERGGMNDE
jgi:hypothetical protein